MADKKSFSESLEMGYDRFEGQQKRTDIFFWTSVGLTQFAGSACIALVTYWVMQYGGLSWNGATETLFNFHPHFMVLGLVFFYGEAIIVYRVLSFLPKWILKIIHASLHLCAVGFSSVAIAAIFEEHRRAKNANLFSLHSWVGIATFGLFCLQYIGGFVTFMLPNVPYISKLWSGLSVEWRTKILPFHTIIGVGIFLAAVATCLMGLTEKLLWTNRYTDGAFTTQTVAGNALGLFLIVFACCVVFITTNAAYKRQALPSDQPQPAVN